MTDFKLTLEPAQSDVDAILYNITEANEEAWDSPAGYQPIAFLLKDPATGETVGGLSGYQLYDWLFIQFLSVPKALQGKGIGSELLETAEAWCKERHLVGMWLDTFDFGPPGFYEKHGFAIFGTIEDHPVGSRRHFLAKRFEPKA
jgi:GNAT superfamily N-acetyltransferase